MKLPVFVTIDAQDGSFVVDNTSGIMVNKTDGDALLLANALSGKLVTSKLYPLIWDDDTTYRGVNYLRNLTDAKIQQLDRPQIQQIVASLRDLVYLHHRNSVTAAPVVVVKDLQDVIHSVSDVLPASLVDSYRFNHGLTITPCPTKRHRVMRWISTKCYSWQDDDDHAHFEEAFLCNPDNNLIMAFCDIDDLYFHNVENIIPLDSMFLEHMPESCLQVSDVEFLSQVNGSEVFTFQLSSCDALLNLTQWSSFVPPMNRDQRGGERMIFRSETLAERLAEAIHPLCTFGSINPVFRLNKFQPTDEGFQSHLDIPYSDSIGKRRSRYTLLLYLTAGHGEPALRAGLHYFTDLEVLQAVIFDQRLEHEGQPYCEGPKIFLRTELLIDWPFAEENYDSEVARVFNIACYNAIFHQELSAYTTKLFDYSVACRFQALAKPSYKLHFHNVDGASYITNGHDYWFTIDVPLQTAAVLTILDYFDGSHCPLKRFRSLKKESHRLLDDESTNDENKIYDYLYSNFDSAIST